MAPIDKAGEGERAAMPYEHRKPKENSGNDSQRETLRRPGTQEKDYARKKRDGGVFIRGKQPVL